mmetsp:Transcript_1662/g.4119  ORF Transcript_1662/g.4119 Transcript_1662/m.4119 type:complete len:250 (+) Transcript_1662:900-1649(+)
MSEVQKASDTSYMGPLTLSPPARFFGGQDLPAFGFAAELIAIPACAKDHIVPVTSMKHCVAVEPLPPPNRSLRAGAGPPALTFASCASRRRFGPKPKSLLEPTFEGTTPAGTSMPKNLSLQAEAIRTPEPAIAEVAKIKPEMAPAHNESTLGTKVAAQLSAAIDKEAARFASSANAKMTLRAQTFACVLFLSNISLDKCTPQQVLEASLMFEATNATLFTACKTLNTQAAVAAFSDGLFSSFFFFKPRR